jgi:hypothetical protein
LAIALIGFLVIEFLHLEEVKDHWGDSAEKGDQHGHFLLVSLNPTDGPHIFGERTLNNTYALTKGERCLVFDLERSLPRLYIMVCVKSNPTMTFPISIYTRLSIVENGKDNPEFEIG